MNMTEVKTAELVGAALDWAVAKAEGHKVEMYLDEAAFRCITGAVVWCGDYCPSAHWAQGGPLLARYFQIIAGMVPVLDMWPDEPADLLPWAMRKIVYFELGDVVSVPSELLEQTK